MRQAHPTIEAPEIPSTSGKGITKRPLTGAQVCFCASAGHLVSLKRLLAELGEDEATPLPRSTFDDWLAKGAAPEGFKLPNGQWRIRRAAVEAWLARLEQGCS
jgi:predicted DNA-binding transcriptional regulator AlpA